MNDDDRIICLIQNKVHIIESLTRDVLSEPYDKDKIFALIKAINILSEQASDLIEILE